MKYFNFVALLLAAFMAMSVPSYTALAQDKDNGSVAEETTNEAKGKTEDKTEDKDSKLPDLSDPVEDGEVQQPKSSDFQALLTALGGIKGFGTLGIIGIIVQMLMLLIRSRLGKRFVGKWRLLAVYGLSLVGGVIGLMAQGTELMTALLHSNTLAAAQVFGHQAYKQFVVKKDEDKQNQNS